MNRATTWIATIALLLVAGGVSAVAPADDAEVSPFFVTGETGEPVTGRNLTATVTDVRTARALTAKDWRGEANWLVVDLEAASVTGPDVANITGSVAMRGAVFVIDGVQFSASERMDSFISQPLYPGVPFAGSLAFELPELTGSGVLQLSIASERDRRLDSVLEVPIDLDALTPRDETAMRETEWAQ